MKNDAELYSECLRLQALHKISVNYYEKAMFARVGGHEVCVKYSDFDDIQYATITAITRCVHKINGGEL